MSYKSFFKRNSLDHEMGHGERSESNDSIRVAFALAHHLSIAGDRGEILFDDSALRHGYKKCASKRVMIPIF
jgi:hypothetical protein